jgi:outer membrane lipoprotein-sorting protein
MKLSKLFICAVLLTIVSAPVFAQITTAGNYLATVGNRYGGIRDYEARINIKSGNSTMSGLLSYRNPSYLRIDFSSPANQVIVFDGQLLTIYLPESGAILTQEVVGYKPGAAYATGPGLTVLRNNYVASFLVGPDPVPLGEGSGEYVVKLRLTRRSVNEGFREIILSINPDTLLIRRIEGRTIADNSIVFDFSSVSTNIGIPQQRFVYDNQPQANTYKNFLFRD